MKQASDAAGLYNPDVAHPPGWLEWIATDEKAVLAAEGLSSLRAAADADAAQQTDEHDDESGGTGNPRGASAVPWHSEGGDTFGLLDGAGYDSGDEGEGDGG